MCACLATMCFVSKPVRRESGGMVTKNQINKTRKSIRAQRRARRTIETEWSAFHREGKTRQNLLFFFFFLCPRTRAPSCASSGSRRPTASPAIPIFQCLPGFCRGCILLPRFPLSLAFASISLSRFFRVFCFLLFFRVHYSRARASRFLFARRIPARLSRSG